MWEVVQAGQPLSSPRDPICILAAFKRHFKTDFSCLDLLSPSCKQLLNSDPLIFAIKSLNKVPHDVTK